MTDAVISVADAVALAQAIPDVVTTTGDVSTKRRAVAVEITRQGPAWRTSFPQEELITLPGGRVIAGPLAPMADSVASVADKTVTLTHPDGRTWTFPVILIQALLGQYYVDRVTGVLAPSAQSLAGIPAVAIP